MIKVNGYTSGIVVSGDGGGGDSNVLFKNGSFQNQDIIKIGLNDGTIVDGKLEFNGLHAGFLIEELNLPVEALSYDIYFKVNSTTGELIQCGTCNPNLDADTDLFNIIHYGTNRITYNNDSLASSTNYWFRLTPTSASNSVFFGDGNAYVENVHPFVIEEIYYNTYDGTCVTRT